MVKISTKRKLIRELEKILYVLILDDKDNTDEFSEIMDIYQGVSTTRNLSERTAIPKTTDLRDFIWNLAPEDEFKAMARMDRASFLRLVDLIKDHESFNDSSPTKKQAAVWMQLLLVMNRIGTNGNGASFIRCGLFNGVSHGTVEKFTSRVFTAILSLKDQVIYWPNAEERHHISRRFGRTYGLHGAVAVVDGTPVVLFAKPGIDGETYYSRKQWYCINLQLFCDDRRKIRNYITGWPGSVFDNTVFDQTHLAQNPALYFSIGQWLLADCGYALKDYVCTPFRQPAASIPHNKIFNEIFSSARVVIEHVNGMLKGRFASLKGLRIIVTKLSDFKRINDWIVVCLILHNLMIDFTDSWDEEDDEDNRYDEDDDEEVPDIIVGESLRDRVQRNVLQWYFN